MKQEPAKDYSLLQQIGLSKSQIACYLKLLEIGMVRTSQLSIALGIPATDLYRTLNLLEKIGFVVKIKQPGTPSYFRALPLEEAIEQYFQYQLKTIRPLIDLRLTRRVRL